jgi:hypothetical protein
MLRHGLQELDGTRIILPARPIDRPDRSGWRNGPFHARKTHACSSSGVVADYKDA